MGYPGQADAASAIPSSMMVAAVPAPAYACDAAGRITFYNARAADLWGRHPALEHPDDRYCGASELYSADGEPVSMEQSFMAEVLRSGEPCEGREIVIGRPDGSRRTVLAYGTPVLGADGTLLGASALLIDVTARQEALRATRDALRVSEANFSGFFENRTVGATLVNAQGRFTSVNDRYCEITGFSRQELLSMGPVDLTHPDDQAEDRERLHEAITNPSGVYLAEKRYRRKDGSAVWVQVAVNFQRDSAGRPVQTTALVTDITERRRAEAALQEADRLKDEFLATLAHELRNPLAPLQHAAEILGHPETADTAWCRAIIDRQVGHLTRLIDDLLDLSRITRDRLDLKKVTIDLARILENAVEESRPMLERHKQTLRSSMPAEPLGLEGDAVRLTQVFTNLLTNAAKFNEQPGTIELRTVVESTHAVVTITDHGIGIAGADLPRLFEKFYQSPRTSGRFGGGLGIGLSLVRRLVELHGGTVEARSAGPGSGSVFIVRLPRTLSVGGARREPALRATSTATPKRILIVDDNNDAADSLSQLLELMGHSTATAYDGRSAIERAKQFSADLVLLDLGMPDVDGFEVCQRLRALELTAPPRIVAMTGWGRSEDRERTRSAGFDAHLVKPVDSAALARVLEEPTPQHARPA